MRVRLRISCTLHRENARPILKRASEQWTWLDRLLSLAIQATTDQRASDHPPPTASSTSGQKVMFAWAQWEDVLRNEFFRDSTEGKTFAKDAGSDMAGPRRRALVTEKSQAS